MPPPLPQFYGMLQESQWWDAARMSSWQHWHLTMLLQHARQTVPFYRFRLHKAFRPDGSIDWDRWSEIPILTRAQLSENFETLLSRAPVAEHGPFSDVSTSGSTGHPVTIRTTRWLNEMSTACSWRAHKWQGLDWSETVVADLGENPRLKIGQSMGPWGPPWLPEAQRGKTIYLTYDTDVATRLEVLQTTRARYHATTPNQAEMLIRHADETGQTAPLKCLLARGGAVTEYLRADLKRVFGADCIELYSSKEAGSMGHPCAHGEGFHVNSEAVLLEVLDDQGRPVPEGEAGRVVVTPFGSTAMPLIRYDHGDIAVVGGRCSCGRTLPLLKEIRGREKHNFRHPDGHLFSVEFSVENRQLIGAGQVQVAQIGRTAFEVRYVRRDWGVARDEAAFLEKFHEEYFPSASVRLVEVDNIPLSAAGKLLERVVEWDGT